MSQTETILLIVLGFSLASLIALFVARLLWTAAVKVGVRRMQRQVPSSLVGLQTERDRLRAEHAMLARRLGDQLEAAQQQVAGQMAEVSRHRNRILELEAAAGNAPAQMQHMLAKIAELEAELIQSRYREDDLRSMLAAHEAAEARLRQTHAAHTPDPAPPPADDPEARLRQRIDQLSELAKAPLPEETVIYAPPPPDEPPLAEAAPPEDAVIDAPPPEDVSRLAEKLAEAERQTAELTRDLEKLDAQWPGGPAEEAASLGDGEDPSVAALTERIRDLKKSLGSSP